jgi:2',3'-cyclic-nucleotide 2'-phosphodiesterase / 3'-nucleotidase
MKSRFRFFKSSVIIFFFLIIFSYGCKPKKITIIETTDLHGVMLPFDYVDKKPLDASLASAVTYIKQVRKKNSNLLLLDNGDNLQGQPEEYYYNFIDTISPHFNAEALNYMKYDAGTVVIMILKPGILFMTG